MSRSMAHETRTLMDGVRSDLEIFGAIAAQADAAGEWPCTRVTLEDVEQYLDPAVAAGLLEVR